MNLNPGSPTGIVRANRRAGVEGLNLVPRILYLQSLVHLDEQAHHLALD